MCRAKEGRSSIILNSILSEPSVALICAAPELNFDKLVRDWTPEMPKQTVESSGANGSGEQDILGLEVARTWLINSPSVVVQATISHFFLTRALLTGSALEAAQ